MVLRLRFIDSIAASPTVRLDLNDGTIWSTKDDGTEFGDPPMRRSVTSSMIRDGDYVGATSYGNRELQLRLTNRVATHDGAATELQKLIKELDRERNLLEYRPDGAASSVWFRTFRSSPDKLHWDAGLRQVTMTILAEPFALGLREDVGTFSVSQAPDVTTNLLRNPSLEVNATDWVVVTNCTIARTTAQAAVGTASLQLTASSAATMTAGTPRGTSGVPVTVGQSVTVQAKFRTAVTARSCRVNIAWFDSGGGLLSTSTGSTVTDSTSAFTLASLTATAPASTAFAAFEATVVTPANAEVHYVDAAMLATESYVSAYLDGDTGGRWTGTAHLSTSIRNGMFFDLTAVKGDVETPLLLTATGHFLETFGGSGVWVAPGCVYGIRPGSAPYPAVFRQAESLTLGTDTTAVADATFSGGSKARISFSTSNLISTARVTGVFPTATFPAGAENRGQYRVFIRAESVTAVQTYKFKFGINPTVTVELNSYPQMIDLGIIGIDSVIADAPGYETTKFGLSNAGTFTLYATRETGADSVDVDYVLLVPATYRLGFWGEVRGSASTDLTVVDSPREEMYSTATNLFTTPRLGVQNFPSFAGSFPMVQPGDNHVVLFQCTGAGTGTGLGTQITDTTSVAAYYWPRYVHVRPAAT